MSVLFYSIVMLVVDKTSLKFFLAEVKFSFVCFDI